MDMKITEKELAILERKAEKPDLLVVCPRCGAKLIFSESKTSYRVKCEKDNCLQMTVRGL